MRSYQGKKWLRSKWAKVLFALALIGVIAFGALEVVVYRGAQTQINGEPEIMIIFGCQVKPWGPSVLLQDRLDTALDYLEENPDMTIVVSGGQGPDEPMTEAQAMYDYLVENGADGDRIYLEDESSNTRENIAYTQELLQELFAAGAVDESGKYLLVSSDFHLTRIKMLWERQWEGTYTISTMAAPCSHVPSRVKMFFREPLALVKSFIFDR